VRPGLVPLFPDLPGLRLQALHSADAAEAYRLAITSSAQGPFNVAADPVLDAHTLGELLGARPLKLPARPLRAAVAAGWRLHLVPASPMLVDLALSLPVMDTSRIRSELGWIPSNTATEAIAEMLAGLRQGEDGPTPPLEAQAGGRLREKEVATGVGQRADLDANPMSS
jgi:nucleoside-diphosphate-sugar epimerase